jgi:hypothetical protein
VASKNTSNGETPDLRTASARNVSPPLVALHDAPFTVTLATLTVTDRLALPPGPVQLSVYVVVPLSGALLALPLMGSFPDQPPEAAQLLALVADQVSSTVPPLPRLVGLALRKILGVFDPAPGDPCPVTPPVTAVTEGPWLFSVMLPSHTVSVAINPQHSATRRIPR